MVESKIFRKFYRIIPVPETKSTAPRASSRFSRIRTNLLPFLILLIGIGGFIALKMSKDAPKPPQAKEMVWKVETLTVTPAAHQPQWTLYGIVEAKETSELRAALAAEVVRTPVQEGQVVESGTPLIELDKRDAQATVAQYQADLAQNAAQIEEEKLRYHSNRLSLQREAHLLKLKEQEYQRVLKLKKEKMIADSQVDQAAQEVERQQISVQTRKLAVDQHPATMQRLEAQQARLQAQLEQAQRNLERAMSRAPYPAIVQKINVSPGMRVRVGDLLATVYTPQPMEAHAVVPHAALSALQNGVSRDEPITATGAFNNANNNTKQTQNRETTNTFSMQLNSLVSAETNQVGSVKAIFTVEGEAAKKLFPGQAIRLQVALPAVEKTIKIPFRALHGDNKIYRIRTDSIVENGKETRQKPVSTSVSTKEKDVSEKPGKSDLAKENKKERENKKKSLKTETVEEITIQQLGWSDRAEGEIVVYSDQLRAGDQIVTTHLPSAMDGLKVQIIQLKNTQTLDQEAR